MSFSRAEHRLLSRPHRIEWAGWESTTTRLQQCGWQLSAEQAFDSGRLRLAFKHEDMRLYGLSEAINYDFFREMNPQDQLIFRVVRVASDFMVQIHDNLSMFSPIDAMPQMVAMERKHIEDFGIFAAPLVRTQEIIVEPQSVTECLEIIKKLQAPELDAIRERNKRRDRRNDSSPIERQVFHAQILSFPRAA